MATPLTTPLIQTGASLALSIGTLAWAWTSARSRVRRDHGAIEADDAWCATLVWTALTVTATGLILGILGRLSFLPWCGAVALASAWLRRAGGSTPGGAGETQQADAPAAPSAWFLMLLGGYLLGRALFSLRNPPWDLDSLDYHLPMIAHWLSSGTLGVALHQPVASATYYPGNFELLQMWAVASAGRDTFVYLPVIFSIGVMAIAARRLAIGLGARRAVAEALALALASAPGIAGMTKGLQADTYIAALLALALRFGLRYRERGSSADAALMLAALGLTAGSRFTGPAFAVAVVALIALMPGTGVRRWPAVPGWLWPTTLLVGAFWLVRNTIACGNPLYPAETVLGPLRLAGLLPHALMSRTTQWAVWREGYAGQLTVAHLYRFYGVSLILIGLGLALGWIARRTRANPAGSRAAPEWPVLALFALASLALYLVSYYSGVNWPPRDGHPAVLTVANVRYLLPGLIALLPLAARGLSVNSWIAGGCVALGIGLYGWQLRSLSSHVLPGLVVAAAFLAALRIPFSAAARARWTPIALPFVLGLPLALAAITTDAVRERASSLAWDDYRARIHVLPGALATRVRSLADGRPVACVGLHTVYQVSGRTFRGRPIYAPVAIPWREATSPWRFATDPRERADRAQWLANLESARAALIVVATEDSLRPPIERAWCAADSTRFRLVARDQGDEVYEIRGGQHP